MRGKIIKQLNKNRFVLLRWLDIFCLCLLGSVLGYFCAPLLEYISNGTDWLIQAVWELHTPPLRFFYESFFGIPFFVIILLWVLVIPLAGILIRIGGLRWRLLFSRYFWLYPPCYLAGVLSSVFLLFLLEAGIKENAVSLLLSFGIIFFASITALLLQNLGCKYKKKEVSAATSLFSAQDNLEKLICNSGNFYKWLEQEEPVQTPDQDLIGTLPLSEEIKEKLTGDTATRIALIGPWGSGKTSILNFVETKIQASSKQREGSRILICWLPSWGLLGESAAASLLKVIIEELSRYADCVGINRLPKEYLSSLNGHLPGWLCTTLNVALSSTPENQLQRLDTILKAINVRIVIFVEDLDRNILEENKDYFSSGGNSKSTLIVAESLLDRLAKVENLSFLLTLNREAAIDLQRIIETEKILPGIEKEKVWTLIQVFYRLLDNYAKEEGDVSLFDESDKGARGKTEVTLMIAEQFRDSWELALGCLLQYPRLLKRVLRQVWDVWKKMHGEVCLTDLLLVNTLRCVAPEVVDFIKEHWLDLAGQRRAFNSETEQREFLQKAWEKLATREDKEKLESVVAYLFPALKGRGKKRGVQGVSERRYWERIYTGQIGEKEIRDQEVLSDFLKWKQNKTKEFVKKLEEEKNFNSIFCSMVSRWQVKVAEIQEIEFRELISETFSLILKKQGVNANGDQSDVFIGFWNLYRNRYGTPDSTYIDWLWGEMEKALAVSLQFRNSIENYWASMVHMRVSPKDYLALRRKTIDWCKKHLTTKKLCELLSVKLEKESSAFILYYFMQGLGREEAAGLMNFSEWTWAVPVLQEALEQKPEILVFQFAVMFLNVQEDRKQEFIDGQPEIVIERQYKLNRKLISELLPNKNQKFDFLKTLKEKIELSQVSEAYGHLDQLSRERLNLTALIGEIDKWVNEEI